MGSANRRLRVLRIITRLNVGGPTRHVALLQAGLDPERFEQILVHGPADPMEGGGLLAVPGERVLVPELRRSPNPWRDRRAATALRDVIRRLRPDIVHTHQGKAGALGRLAAAAESTPGIVHTCHGHTFEGYFDPLTAALVRRIERKAATVSHRLVCQARSQAEELERRLGAAVAGKTIVIPPAIDERFFAAPSRERARAAAGIGREAFVLLFCARLVPIKRPLSLVPILEALRDRELALWVAGDGPLRNKLESLARRRGVFASLRFLGYTPDPSPLYAAADALLLTSRMEGTPLAALESMAAGTPVIAPNVGAMEEVVGEGGVVLPKSATPRDYADAIRTLRDDPTRARSLGLAGKARAASRHRSAELLASISELYERVLQR